MVRLIDTDNFGRDYPDEKFYCLGNSPLRLPREEAEEIAEILNRNCHLRFCRVVEDDYVLQGSFEP